MGERKPVNTYIPADFDPSKPARRCKPQNGQHQVRFMLPMSIKCNVCGDYMFQGTKANCRKELCYDDFYLGINVYRIYLHCKSCYSEITIMTDPKNLDYHLEKGATRHFEPWRRLQVENALEEKKRLSGTLNSQIEEKIVNNQRELDHINEIERLKAISSRQLNVDFSKIKSDVVKNENLNPEDLQRIENFTPEEKTGDMNLPIKDAPVIPKKIFAWGAAQKKSLIQYDSESE